MLLGLLLIVLVISGSVMGLALRQGLRQQRRFRLACSLEGLSATGPTRAWGFARGRPVCVALRSGGGQLGTWIEIDNLACEAALQTREIAGSRRALSDFAMEIETGDAAFDQAFCLLGEERAALALAGAALRERALELAAAGQLEVRGGQLRVKVDRPLLEPEALRAVLDEALALADLLSPPPDALERNAFEDPLPAVRSRCLEVLLGAAEDRERAALVERALDSRDPRLRFLAARDLGPDGHPVLAALTVSESTPAALRVAALVLLADGQRGYLEPALRGALAGAPAVAEAAARVARERGLTRVLPALLDRCRQVGLTDRLAASLAQAIGALAPAGDHRAEDALIGMLARSGETARRAAVVGLACVGTPRAVPALRQLTGRGSSARLKQVAQHAVRAVQARAVQAEVGAIALAEIGDAGGFAFAGAGEVSLAE